MVYPRRTSGRLKQIRKNQRIRSLKMPKLASHDRREHVDQFEQSEFLCVFGLVSKSIQDHIDGNSDDEYFESMKRIRKRNISHCSDIANNNVPPKRRKSQFNDDSHPPKRVEIQNSSDEGPDSAASSQFKSIYEKLKSKFEKYPQKRIALLEELYQVMDEQRKCAIQLEGVKQENSLLHFEAQLLHQSIDYIRNQ